MSDIWDDDGDDLATIEPGNQNATFHSFPKDLDKLEEIHSNEGYKAGITAGQSKSAQEGFDAGYRKGADSAIEFGQILGQVIGVSHLQLGKELQMEVDNLVEEGRMLSELAGKQQLSKEEIEEFRRKCNVLMEKAKAQGSEEQRPSSS